MSIHVTNRVWAHSQAQGSARLVLLAIADHCDDDGFAWPGVTSLARKAHICERQTHYAIKQLMEQGELQIVPSKGGRTCTNLYLVVAGLSPAQVEAAQARAENRMKKMLDWRKTVQPAAPAPDPQTVQLSGETVQRIEETVQPGAQTVQSSPETVHPAAPESSVKSSPQPPKNQQEPGFSEEELEIDEATWHTWQLVLKTGRDQAGSYLDKLLGEARPLGFDEQGQVFTILAVSAYQKELLESRVLPSMQRWLSGAAGRPVQAAIICPA